MPQLLHAQFVKQVQGRKSDVADSIWLARICQFGLCRPSYVPPRKFRQLRQLCRYRRKLVGERSRARNRIHKTLDHDGLRLGGALSDIFGRNGRKILEGLAAGDPPAEILASLSGHVRHKRELLEQVLEAQLDAHAVWKLRDLLRAHDAANTSIAELDARMAEGHAELAEQVRLLETVPGIDRGSACAILVELGPSTRPLTWPPGPGWPRATTRVPASGARGACGAAMPRCGLRWPSVPTVRRAARARSSTATSTRSRRACPTRKPSWRRRTSCWWTATRTAAQARRARLSRRPAFRQPAGAGLRPIPAIAHRRRRHATATDTERGYRGGPLIRRLVDSHD